MATGDLANFNGVMKIVGGRIEKQYEESALMHNRLQKGAATKISDRGAELPTALVPNANHAWITDGGDFPAGGSPLAKRMNVYFKNYAHSLRLTGAAIDALNSGDVAYVEDVLQYSMKESVSQAKKMLNVYAWGTGNGRLATISSGASSATQTVSNNDANRFLRNGLKIQTITTTDGTITGSGTILNAQASSTTFTTVATLSTSVTSDIVVAYGSYNLAPMGIAGMIDDTTNGGTVFQGLSRSTYPILKSTRVSAASTGLDQAFLRRVLSAGIHISAGELNRDALEMWSHPAQTTAYQALGQNMRRFDGKSKSVDLGFTAYEYEGINWVEAVDAPKDRVYFINFTTMGKYEAKKFGWDEKTGSALHQVPSATSGIAYTDQAEAWYTGRFNYGCVRPNLNGFVDLCAVPTGF